MACSQISSQEEYPLYLYLLKERRKEEMVSLFPLCPEGLLQNYRTRRFALKASCEDFVTDHEGLILGQ